MAAICIETTIDPETLHLPRLKPQVCKGVEIFVLEKAAPGYLPTTSKWAAVETAVRELNEFDAWHETRETKLGCEGSSSQVR